MKETSSIDDLNFLRANGDSCLLKSGDDCLPVKGRLRGALNFWNNIHAPQFILDVIKFGYKLPFLQIPSPFVARNNSSALDESYFVESAINELILQGCVSEVFKTPAIINPLSFSIQKSGKKRLILDLRHVNQFLYKTKFRCEDVSVAKEILNPGDFMFTFDLNQDITMWRYFQNAESIFHSLGPFLPDALDILSFLFYRLASALHLICLQNCLGL